MTSLGELRETKSDWRRTLAERRRSISETTRSAEADSLRSVVLRWAERRTPRVVAAYVPVRGEPGSAAMLDALRGSGCRVLLPIVVGAAPLDWAEYTGADSLDPARYGLLEPNGPRLGPAEIGAADSILVPALAVDRRGVRLGRGAGHYDRSLPLADPAARLIGVVRDAEFVAALPGEEHDVRMHAVMTPGHGVVPIDTGDAGHAV
ncbi:5-formyltetrahydrofolate cyclo-ligase [Saccharopolyspora sp. NFXS83]|nr:5-formyltetrahydrofolate cyclo-ligase [Saccharopolyspora sp. NFXS83]MCX2732035.1 5-formyltetrahydrofolate cyclo-ligase [Saccharopolyspora sp. NFXS83]